MENEVTFWRNHYACLALQLGGEMWAPFIKPFFALYGQKQFYLLLIEELFFPLCVHL